MAKAATCLLASTLAASCALGQWTVTFLDPPDSDHTVATSVFEGQQGGHVLIDWTYRASLWSGSGASRLDLHPDGAASSWVSDVGSGVQGGTLESTASATPGSGQAAPPRG